MYHTTGGLTGAGDLSHAAYRTGGGHGVSTRAPRRDSAARRGLCPAADVAGCRPAVDAGGPTAQLAHPGGLIMMIIFGIMIT